jgi:hypothetical protein
MVVGACSCISSIVELRPDVLAIKDEGGENDELIQIMIVIGCMAVC